MLKFLLLFLSLHASQNSFTQLSDKVFSNSNMEIEKNNFAFVGQIKENIYFFWNKENKYEFVKEKIDSFIKGDFFSKMKLNVIIGFNKISSFFIKSLSFVKKHYSDFLKVLSFVMILGVFYYYKFKALLVSFLCLGAYSYFNEEIKKDLQKDNDSDGNVEASKEDEERNIRKLFYKTGSRFVNGQWVDENGNVLDYSYDKNGKMISNEKSSKDKE